MRRPDSRKKPRRTAKSWKIWFAVVLPLVVCFCAFLLFHDTPTTRPLVVRNTNTIITRSPAFLDRLASPLDRDRPRAGFRPPRVAIILGNMENTPHSQTLVLVFSSLRELGYIFEVYAEDLGEARMWEKVGKVSFLEPTNFYQMKWLSFQGIVAVSVQVKEVILRLRQGPFSSLPLILILDDGPVTEEFQDHSLSFRRASVVVVHESTLQVLHESFDAVFCSIRDSLAGYGILFETIFTFPPDILLPGPLSRLADTHF